MSDRYLNKIMGDRENIILVSRQHWIVLFQSITINLLLALLIGGVSYGIYLYLNNPLAFLLLGLLGIPMVRLLNHYMNWLNEEYVVTNFRVIQLRGVFSKNVIDSSLEKVNDVKLAQTFIGRIFNYGDIEILTASELGVNLFEKILNPIQFKTTMQNAKEALEYKPPEPAVAIQKEDIVGLISKLDHLHLDGTISDDEFKIKKAELMARL